MQTRIEYAHDIGKYTLHRNDPKGKRIAPWGTFLPGQHETGYGLKITTDIVLKFQNEKRERRVYATCISNAASHWIMYNGRKVHLMSHDSTDILD